ncbi:MAG: hypothetical protein ACLTG4_08360 [Oscillospiraceae bacterium]
MYWYTIGQTLTQQERAPAPEQPAVVLLTSEELSHQPALSGLERTLHHTPPARDARSKAEVRRLPVGTLVLPRQGKDKPPPAAISLRLSALCSWTTKARCRGCAARPGKRWTDGSVGQFLRLFEQLIARDLHQLEKSRIASKRRGSGAGASWTISPRR